MKTDVEYELLNIRQNIKDNLQILVKQKEINFRLSNQLKVKLKACNYLLKLFKLKKAG